MASLSKGALAQAAGDITKEQAINIVKEQLKKSGKNSDDFIFSAEFSASNTPPVPVMYKSKDFKDDTGIVNAMQKTAEKPQKAPTEGVWDVVYYPKNRDTSHCQPKPACNGWGIPNVLVNAKTGKAGEPMFAE